MNMNREKLHLFDRFMRVGCHHCGCTRGKLYNVQYFDDEIITVCDECYSMLHLRSNSVIIYINEINTPQHTVFDNYMNGIGGEMFIVHKDDNLNDGNILEQALFNTVEFNGCPSYFVVPSILTFSNFKELKYVIDKVMDRDCIFYSQAEGIDSSTDAGKNMIDLIYKIADIEARETEIRINRALATKQFNKDCAALNDSNEPVDQSHPVVRKEPIKKGYTPNEFYICVGKWRNGHMTIKEAAARCNMSVATFKRRLKSFNMI